jgi:hypothetical protein
LLKIGKRCAADSAIYFWRNLIQPRVIDTIMQVIDMHVNMLLRELKHVGRQHDDDGQNKFLQINDSKENLLHLIIRMNLIQYKN